MAMETYNSDQLKYKTQIEELSLLVKGEEKLYINNDERTLLRFLYYSDFNIEGAFNKIKSFYKMKFDYPKWFATDVNTKAQLVAMKRNVHCVLLDKDDQGRRIYILRLGNVVVGEVEPWEMFQVDDLWLELAQDEPETQQNGLVFIFDMKNLTWKYLTYFTPHNCKVGSSKAENIPIRKTQYHVVNSGFILNSLVTVLFPFLSNSTKSNIFFHKSDWSSLHKHISKDILPVEYGGNKPHLDYDFLRKSYIDKNQSRLKELLSYGYRE